MTNIEKDPSTMTERVKNIIQNYVKLVEFNTEVVAKCPHCSPQLKQSYNTTTNEGGLTVDSSQTQEEKLMYNDIR